MAFVTAVVTGIGATQTEGPTRVNLLASPVDLVSSAADLSDSTLTTGVPALADPAAGLPGLPTLTPQIPDAFLDLVQKIDGDAFTTDILGLFDNNDIIGTIAMQINVGLSSNELLESLGVNVLCQQILDGDWSSLLPNTTDFFEEFVTNLMNPDAFTAAGLPANPGDFIEIIAYELDNILANTVYATDLNLAALVLWP